MDNQRRELERATCHPVTALLTKTRTIQACRLRILWSHKSSSCDSSSRNIKLKIEYYCRLIFDMAAERPDLVFLQQSRRPTQNSRKTSNNCGLFAVRLTTMVKSRNVLNFTVKIKPWLNPTILFMNHKFGLSLARGAVDIYTLSEKPRNGVPGAMDAAQLSSPWLMFWTRIHYRT